MRARAFTEVENLVDEILSLGRTNYRRVIYYAHEARQRDVAFIQIETPSGVLNINIKLSDQEGLTD